MAPKSNSTIKILVGESLLYCTACLGYHLPKPAKPMTSKVYRSVTSWKFNVPPSISSSIFLSVFLVSLPNSSTGMARWNAGLATYTLIIHQHPMQQQHNNTRAHTLRCAFQSSPFSVMMFLLKTNLPKRVSPLSDIRSALGKMSIAQVLACEMQQLRNVVPDFSKNRLAASGRAM